MSRTNYYLKDYQTPEYKIEQTDLIFRLFDTHTEVQAKLICTRLAETSVPLRLHGADTLTLKKLVLDGRILTATEYTCTEDGLTLDPGNAQQFCLESTVVIDPKANTALSGLYRSNALYCTQCEAQGFRRITYYLDQPDVLSEFRVRIEADRRGFPVLLSNGNLLETGLLDNDRHFALWHDPHPKPSYLFALVAGQLMAVEDQFVTRSGRLVTLKLYVEPENLDKTAHAMQALKKSMVWDENTYDREYDLDIYMIVAVNDFNMGAMENKGLNVFNSQYVLARPETATDIDFQNIDDVVGHEYFHNWSGNRITLRDWFQLSLKEGLTVFREQHFSQDISQSPVSLIQNARLMRSKQFSEDAGPMRHPVRPASYKAIDNFYTLTVYEKGAQVIRLLQTWLTQPVFKKGLNRYFDTMDGKAATVEDFLAAMSQVSSYDLTQFKRWYTQAGTPEIAFNAQYDPEAKTYTLHLTQSIPNLGGAYQPMVIPVKVGLLSKTGETLCEERILNLNTLEETFVFEQIKAEPVVSLLRDFSAPVKIVTPIETEALACRMAYDPNEYNRWDAAFAYTKRMIVGQVKKTPLPVEPWLKAFEVLITRADLNPALKAQAMQFPVFEDLIAECVPVDVDALFASIEYYKTEFAKRFESILLQLYQSHTTPGAYQYTTDSVNKRQLKNVCLGYLLRANEKHIELATAQYNQSDNMTDTMGALQAVNHLALPQRDALFADFYEKFKEHPLVVNKWLGLQAVSQNTDTLKTVQTLLSHDAFDLKNPNKVYALIGGFCSGNPWRFHAASGGGYTFLKEQLEQLDRLNPQIAAKLVTPLIHWRQFDPKRQAAMQAALLALHEKPDLSKNLGEMVQKALEVA